MKNPKKQLVKILKGKFTFKVLKDGTWEFSKKDGWYFDYYPKSKHLLYSYDRIAEYMMFKFNLNDEEIDNLMKEILKENFSIEVESAVNNCNHI